jgi:hypothetical protein
LETMLGSLPRPGAGQTGQRRKQMPFLSKKPGGWNWACQAG